MILHPWLSGINNSPFGKKAQSKVSASEYKQILLELNFMLQLNAIPEDKYRNLINEAPDGWFDLGEDAGYYVSNDKIESRKAVKEFMNNTGSKNARHILDTRYSKTGTKTVRVHQNVPTLWRTAIVDAIAAWNGLGYGVKFAIAYTNSSNDSNNLAGEIDIYYQSTDPDNSAFVGTVYAATKRPSVSGGVGETMCINSTRGITSASCKKMVAAHELGHAIGMLHTDGAYALYYFIANVPGCGDGFTDYTSIMNKGDWMYDNIPWQGFTPCDKAVIATYWPKWLV